MADWTPALLGGDALKLWCAGNLNADQEAGAKTVWTDASPNANTVSAVNNTSTNPALVLAALNGLPVFRFNNNNGFDLVSDFGIGGNRFTIFQVAKCSDDVGTNDLWTSRIPNDSGFATRSSNGSYTIWTYDPNWNTFGDFVAQSRYGVADDLNWHTHTQVWAGQYGNYGSIDGDVSQNTQPIRRGTVHFLADLTTGISIAWDRGANGAGFWANAWNGDIAEFGVLRGSATPALRQVLDGYLNHKYGIQANLPAGHPYKSLAPEDNALAGQNLFFSAPNRRGTSLFSEYRHGLY